MTFVNVVAIPSKIFVFDCFHCQQLWCCRLWSLRCHRDSWSSPRLLRTSQKRTRIHRLRRKFARGGYESHSQECCLRRHTRCLLARQTIHSEILKESIVIITIITRITTISRLPPPLSPQNPIIMIMTLPLLLSPPPSSSSALSLSCSNSGGIVTCASWSLCIWSVSVSVCIYKECETFGS